MDKRVITICLIITLTATSLALTLNMNLISGQGRSRALRIFHAGSLSVPLRQVAERFEEENPGVEVVLEPSGSVLAVRKIIELDKAADILMTADYRLINDMMMPNHADFNIAFASNKMVLAYTDKSRYSDEIDPENWFKILMREDVRYGFSNPNNDPCGYRALTVLALAEEYHGLNLLMELVVDRSNVVVEKSDDEYFIYVPKDFAPRSGSNLVIRSKSVDLIALLETGAIDYAFEYKSVAIQRGLRYVELPSQIDLSDPRLDEEYGKVRIYLFHGTDEQREVRGKSIIYGLTIPKCAENRDLAIKFVNLLLSDEGREIFEENGQSFLDRLIIYGSVPREIELG